MYLLIFTCSILFTLSNCTAQDKKPGPKQGINEGQLAPDFTLNDLNGKKITLSSLKKEKKTVCLSFWATWCPYCIREISKLKSLHSKFSSRGLKILSINIAANDPLYRVTEFVKKKGMPYSVLYDKTQTVSRSYGVSGIPVSIIIDADGMIVFRGYGLPENVEFYFEKTLVSGSDNTPPVKSDKTPPADNDTRNKKL